MFVQGFFNFRDSKKWWQFLIKLKHGAVTYSWYIQIKTRGPTWIQHYVYMKKFQCSSQMCVPEYVYLPHVRCINFFKFFLLMRDYTISAFLYQGFHAQSVCIVFFLRRYRIKQKQIWMPFGFDAHALKITKPYRLASWEPSENIFVFSCDVLLFQQKIYLSYLLCYKRTCVVSGKFKNHKIKSLLILFQTASLKERTYAHLHSNHRWVPCVIYLSTPSFVEYKVGIM